MRAVHFAVGFSVFLLAPAGRGAEFTFPDRTFTVPDGFVVERVAGPPLVERPIACDFDEEGRLYVTESSGSNDPVQKQLADKPHRVLRLEDTDGDGAFDKRTVFADKLMLPQGAMWFRGSLYVAAPPSIWKLTDTDDDGVADKREEWFAGKTLTGCANDLHGPYRGRDGWIYWCKGAFAEQTYDLPGKKGWKTRAAHIFRARPDGTGIEPVMTGGMDNPVDVVFTPEGERIFSCTFLVHPGGGKRDGLIHAIYGGVYGKDHNVLDGHPRTGDLMPVMTHLGPAAPCGLHHLESAHLGDDWKGDLLCCQFNLRKVSRHKLIPDGATYKTEDSDLLTSEAMDFHPTDVIEDADGSAIVCDTGGWYKLCCPTSQFHRPEALGAIYRVRRADAKKLDDPRGSKMNWAKMLPDELVLYLDDPRHVVRERAIENLAARPEEAYELMSGLFHEGHTFGKEGLRFHKRASEEALLNAVWASCRIDESRARTFVRGALSDDSPRVRRAAIHVASLWRDRNAAWQIGALVADPWAPTARAAAEAFGRIGIRTGDPTIDGTILGRVDVARDRAQEHSRIYAAIESMNTEAATSALSSGDAFERRAALFALDGMDGQRLTIDALLPHLSSDSQLVRDAAWSIAERNSEWADRLAALLDGQLRSVGQDDERAKQLADRIAHLAQAAKIQAMLAKVVADANHSAPVRQTALAAMAHARLPQLPDAWFAETGRLVERREMIGDAIAVLRSHKPGKHQAAQIRTLLLSVAENESVASAIRLAALDALGGSLGEPPAAAFAFLHGCVRQGEEPQTRASAVAVMARSKLSATQLRSLAPVLADLGPFEIAQLVPLYEQAADNESLTTAVGALEASPAAAQLSAAALRPFVEKLPASLRERGDKLLLRADANFAQQTGKLESLLAAFKETPGDVQRGRAIFHGKKAACAGCHAIAYVGGQVGPDLTRVGQIRTQRDLVEAIAFPSASFVRSYEPVLVVTADGRQINGLVREESSAEIVLATAADKTERIAREDIEAMRPGTVSVMPQGLDAQLTPQELADVVAFLQSCR
ncbi:MAG: dehydrogenase [Planctomycetota bacterium]|nr:MAG: dehydrogenase [Planctomycetota bacterium]